MKKVIFIFLLALSLFTLSCASRPNPLVTVEWQTPAADGFTPAGSFATPTNYKTFLTVTAHDYDSALIVYSWDIIDATSSPNGTLTRVSDTCYEYQAPINPGNQDTIQVTITDGRFTSTATKIITVPSVSDPRAPSLSIAGGTQESVALQWSRNTETDLAGYLVWRSTENTTTFEPIANLPAEYTYYVDNSAFLVANNDLTYYYYLQAYDSSYNTSNYSHNSNTVLSYTPQTDGIYTDVLAPLAPTLATYNQLEQALSFSVTNNGDQDAFGDVKAIELWMSSNGGSSWTLQSTTCNTTAGRRVNYYLTGLTNETSLNFFCTAIDLAGNRATSNQINLCPHDYPPAVPTDLTANQTAQGIRISWTDNSDPDLAGYYLYRTTTENSEVSPANQVTVNSSIISAGTNYYDDTTVSGNISYHYRLKAVDDDGDLTQLFSDYSTNITFLSPEIYVMEDQFGSQGSTLLGEFSDPAGIAIDSIGRLYVSDSNNSRVQILEEDGTGITEASGTLRVPANIDVETISGSTYFMVADQSGVTGEKIYRFIMVGNQPSLNSTFGQAGTENYGLSEAYAIAFNTSNIFVSDIRSSYERVIRYSFATLATQNYFAHNDGIGNPYDIELDSEGNVYVVDSDNSRIFKYDSSGNFVTRFGTAGSGQNFTGDTTIYLSNPSDLVIDESDGLKHLYITDTDNDRVVKIREESDLFTFRTSFGTTGSGENQFNDPRGIAISPVTGKIFIVDSGNNRIQVYDNR